VVDVLPLVVERVGAEREAWSGVVEPVEGRRVGCVCGRWHDGTPQCRAASTVPCDDAKSSNTHAATRRRDTQARESADQSRSTGGWCLVGAHVRAGAWRAPVPPAAAARGGAAARQLARGRASQSSPAGGCRHLCSRAAQGRRGRIVGQSMSAIGQWPTHALEHGDADKRPLTRQQLKAGAARPAGRCGVLTERLLAG
jgi:hypothetical protein